MGFSAGVPLVIDKVFNRERQRFSGFLNLSESYKMDLSAGARFSFDALQQPLEQICESYLEIVDFSHSFLSLKKTISFDSDKLYGPTSELVFHELGYVKLLDSDQLKRFTISDSNKFDQNFEKLFESFLKSFGNANSKKKSAMSYFKNSGFFCYALGESKKISNAIDLCDGLIRIFIKIAFDHLRKNSVDDYDIDGGNSFPSTDTRKFVNATVAEAVFGVAVEEYNLSHPNYYYDDFLPTASYDCLEALINTMWNPFSWGRHDELIRIWFDDLRAALGRDIKSLKSLSDDAMTSYSLEISMKNEQHFSTMTNLKEKKDRLILTKKQHNLLLAIERSPGISIEDLKEKKRTKSTEAVSRAVRRLNADSLDAGLKPIIACTGEKDNRTYTISEEVTLIQF